MMWCVVRKKWCDDGGWAQGSGDGDVCMAVFVVTRRMCRQMCVGKAREREQGKEEDKKENEGKGEKEQVVFFLVLLFSQFYSLYFVLFHFSTIHSLTHFV